jgi:hypothetical protein
MDKQEVERLLYESEGDELDFKRDQYPLTNSDEKAELIKDILAFANGWRRSDAYILIGIDQAKVAGRSTPVGITKHLQDSNLQQLVNSKTNHHVTFGYEEASLNGLQIGVINIPVQDRPRFLTSDFGKLKKDVVYVRRGSSTAEAGLDEILRMKAGPTAPILDLQFAHIEARKPLGKQLSLVSEIVEYDGSKIRPLSVSPFEVAFSRVNQNYPIEMAAYIAKRSLLNGIGFCLKNSATTLAVNVHLEVVIVKSPLITIIDEWDYPSYPQYQGFSLIHGPLVQSSAHVESFGNDVQIKVKFGNIQPGQTAWSNGLVYVGAKESTVINLDGFLYGDNLPAPLPIQLQLKIDTRHRQLDMTELEKT